MSCYCLDKCKVITVGDELYLQCNQCFFFASVKANEWDFCKIKMLCDVCCNPKCVKAPEKKKWYTKYLNPFKDYK